MHNWVEINCSGSIKLEQIPVLSSLEFEQVVCDIMDDGAKILCYFARQLKGDKLHYIIFTKISGLVYSTSFISSKVVPTLTIRVPSIMIFEREIAELYGVNFVGNNWLKPVRCPYNRHDQSKSIEDYQFFSIENSYLHEVHVGPVHAGIIEPGAFRFICEGEKIHHLEICLGFQHRAVEHQICKTKNRLRQICIAETIAGDTTIAHTTAMCKIFENGWNSNVINLERALALEIERIAMHIADTGALAMDTAYQTAHVACEALRTIVVNSMQTWCGNRFGRTLVRPFGTHHRLDIDMIEAIRVDIEDVKRRYKTVAYNLLSSPDFLARIDEICYVDPQIAQQQGAIGMAGVGGDLQTRLKIRTTQVEQSCDMIFELLKKLSGAWFEKVNEPIYDKLLDPKSISISCVNGWRGVVIHVALSDGQGEIEQYKIYDPSMRNWVMLALSVRGAEISDFPLSNKSYNLSYCGNDL